MRSPLLVLLLVLALTTATPLAAARADAPVVAVGDYFDVKNTIDTNGVTSITTAHSVVQAIEKISVGGIAYDALKFVTTSDSNTTTSGFTTTTSTTSTSWIGATDGASLKSTSSSTTSTTTTIPGVPPQSSTSSSETIYDRPCMQIQWGFDVSDHWATTCFFNTTSTTNGVKQTTASSIHSTTNVDSAPSVTVPAGTFSSFLLITTYTDATTGANSTVDQWYSPDACTSVKSTSGSGANTVTTELTKFQCAAKSGGTTTTTTTTSTTTTTTSTTTTTTSTPSDTSTTTSTTTTTTSSTPTPTSKPTGVPGPQLGLVLAGIAAVAVLAARRRA